MVKKIILLTIMIISTFTIVKAEQIENRYVPNIWYCAAKNDSCKYPYSGDYGGFYKDITGNSIFYYFYTPITFTKGKYTKAYIPITITDPNAVFEERDALNNGYHWIFEIRDGIFVRAQWKNTNGGELSSLCMATAFQNNNSIIYECNIPTEAVAFNYLNINYKMSTSHGNYAEIVVKFGVADTIEFAIDTQTNVNNSISNINNNLTDSSVSSSSDVSNTFNNFDSYIPTNNTIGSLLTLPLTLFQNVLNSINGTCQSFSLGSLLGTELVLPCINLSSYLGSTLYGVVDVLFSGLFVLTISKKFIAVFNNFTAMKEGDVLSD